MLSMKKGVCLKNPSTINELKLMGLREKKRRMLCVSFYKIRVQENENVIWFFPLQSDHIDAQKIDDER